MVSALADRHRGQRNDRPARPGPDTRSYEVIHLGGQAAVVVPVADFLWLRALVQAASPKNSRTPRTPRRCWSGRPGRRRRDDVRARRRGTGSGSVCPGEPCGPDTNERAINQAAASRRPRRAYAGSWTRSDRPAEDPARPDRSPTGRPAFGGCGSAGTRSGMRSPTSRRRSGTSPAAAPGADRRTSLGLHLTSRSPGEPRRLWAMWKCRAARGAGTRKDRRHHLRQPRLVQTSSQPVMSD